MDFISILGSVRNRTSRFLKRYNFKGLAWSRRRAHLPAISGSSFSIPVDHVIDMVAHKKPDPAVMEIDLVTTSQSTWLKPNTDDRSCRAACRQYLYTSSFSTNLLKSRQNNQQYPFAEFAICDIMKPNQDILSQGKQFDLVIVKLISSTGSEILANFPLSLFCSLQHLQIMSKAP